MCWRFLFQSWKEATFVELKMFIKVKLNIALVQLSHFEDYWLTHEILNHHIFVECLVINCQCACAPRVTVVVLCVCVYVCMCVHSYLLPQTLESQKKDTNRFIAIQGSFYILLIFLKILQSKVMA